MEQIGSSRHSVFEEWQILSENAESTLLTQKKPILSLDVLTQAHHHFRYVVNTTSLVDMKK